MCCVQVKIKLSVFYRHREDVHRLEMAACPAALGGWTGGRPLSVYFSGGAVPGNAD